MGRFAILSTDAFDELQVDAGVLLDTFDIQNPYTVPTSEHIIATTQGGVNPVCKPTYSDFASDVDNAPTNCKEFKHLDEWLATLSFTTIKFNADNAKMSLGSADKELLENGVTEVTPRRDLKQSDFHDVWWVGDKANGGAVAIRLINALSTEGISIQSTKNGKGTMGVTLTGHVSLANQNEMPMKIYDIPPQEV